MRSRVLLRTRTQSFPYRGWGSLYCDLWWRDDQSCNNKFAPGRQSQFEVVDPQLSTGNKKYSAWSIKEGFDKARENEDMKLAHFGCHRPASQPSGPKRVCRKRGSLHGMIESLEHREVELRSAEADIEREFQNWELRPAAESLCALRGMAG